MVVEQERAAWPNIAQRKDMWQERNVQWVAPSTTATYTSASSILT